jgi:anti-anti-sigma regulatory factor
MELEKQSSDTEIRIAIAGDLTLNSAQQLRTELLECFGSGKAAEIDLAGVTEIDLACLQVLLAAQNSFARHSRRLVIREGDRVRQTRSEAGYAAGEVSSG